MGTVIAGGILVLIAAARSTMGRCKAAFSPNPANNSSLILRKNSKIQKTLTPALGAPDKLQTIVHESTGLS